MEGILPILSSLAQQVHFSINLQSSMGAPDWAAFHVSAQDKLLTCPRQTPFLSMTFKRSPWSSLNELEDDERKQVSLMRQSLSTLPLLEFSQSHDKSCRKKTWKYDLPACMGRRGNWFCKHLCLSHVIWVETSRESTNFYIYQKIPTRLDVEGWVFA